MESLKFGVYCDKVVIIRIHMDSFFIFEVK